MCGGGEVLGFPTITFLPSAGGGAGNSGFGGRLP
jgi:hypothetical protein